MMNPFEKLLVVLAIAEIEFIVVGGIAVSLNGIVRSTDDIDIIVESSKANIEKLLQTLENYGEGFARELDVSDFDDTEGAIRLIEEFPLDMFTRMSGNTYYDLLPESIIKEMQGKMIRFLGPEGLILLKEKSLRPQDQIDVQHLKKLIEDNT